MSGSFFDKVYGLDDVAETRALYDDWSKSYESEVADNGYATPARCAKALASAMPDITQPILDFGCGTGLSGLAFKLNGFALIDGVDLSADMLALAKAKGIYRSLKQIEADDTLDSPAQYAAVAAVGVIGAGAAPLSVLVALFDQMASGTFLCFSFNDHTLEDASFEGYVNDLIAGGHARLISRDYGDHLPGLNMKSVVYVLEKT